MKKYLFLFLFIWGNSLFSQESLYPEVKNSRPRIYIDSSRFAYLSANRSTGKVGEAYTSFIGAVYNNWYNDPELYLLGNDSSKWTWTFSSKWAAMQGKMVPAIYMITKDSIDLKRCTFLANKFIAYYDTINFENYDWYTNETTIRNFSDNCGILLDWCYENLNPQIRQRFVKMFYKINRYFMDTYITSSAGDSYVSSHNAWNSIYANQNALVLYNANELSYEEKIVVKDWFEITYDKWRLGFLPCYGYFRDDDGGWNWTAAYSMWSLVDQFQLFENIKIATGQNLYQELEWVKNSINQYWYYIQPNGWTINWGDGFTRMDADRVMHIHAREFKDPRSQWLAQEYSKPEAITWTWPLFQNLLYKDFEMPKINKPNMPLNWFADKVGLSVSRTNWDTSAALVWFFNSPTKKAAHEHRDNNSFCVYKNAPQIINSGYYASYGDDHYKNYYQRTIAHNSICIYDPEEKYYYGGNIVSNDGGQTESPTLMNYNNLFEEQFQKGKWKNFIDDTLFCYSSADATLSYDSNKVKLFERRLLFYKPDIVVVSDNLILKDSEAKKREAKFILHFQQKPEINGTITKSEIPGHIETYNGNEIFQQNGNGNVAIRTLYPQNTNTTLVGGDGYEFYVDGVNYPVNTVMDTINTTQGKWRIEVSPNKTIDTMTYVHSIKIGDELNPAEAIGQAKVNKTTVCVDIDTVLFFFKGTNPDFWGYRIDSIEGGRTVDMFFPELDYGVNYLLQIDNSWDTLIYTNKSNFQLFTNRVIPEGKHSISLYIIIPDDVEQSYTQSDIKLFPTPNNGVFSLNYDKEKYPNTEIEIYDLSGSIIYKSNYSSDEIINLANMANGTYIIKFSSMKSSKYIKFVIEK